MMMTTNEQQHTPELWEQQGCFIWRDGHRVAEALAMDTDLAFANAAWIVACVNACEGMKDPGAEIAFLRQQNADMQDIIADGMRRNADLRQTIAELVAVLDAIDDTRPEIAKAKAVLNA